MWTFAWDEMIAIRDANPWQIWKNEGYSFSLSRLDHVTVRDIMGV